MTECNGCGSCCDPVVMPYTQVEAALFPPGVMAPAVKRWILRDLTPISKEEALAKEPQFIKRISTAMALAGENLYYYRCRHFDEVSRSCRIYSRRPFVCRVYPWLNGTPPVPETILPPTCSFRADIGQPVEIRTSPKGDTSP